MNTYEFAESHVATGVTLLVSAWFLVAGGAILADPESPYTARPVAEANAASIVVAETPAYAETIVVEAKRLLPVVVAAGTIVVEAKRLKV